MRFLDKKEICRNTLLVRHTLIVLALMICATHVNAWITPYPWRQSPLSVISSELSPAILVHSPAKRIVLFGNLHLWGLGEPTHLAFDTKLGIRLINRPIGSVVNLTSPQMSAPWMLVWFHGATGWEKWDSAWLVVWQHRLENATLDSTGLHATVQGGVGYVALMPLYGLYKPRTAVWKTVPPDAARKCVFWSRALLRYPVKCEETFRIDPKADSVVIRDQFRWIDWQDDWRTHPLKFAPISPTLALAYIGGRMPVKFTRKVYNPGLFTSYGPYMGCMNCDSYEEYFPVLHYITQTEEVQKPNLSDPIVAQAYARLQDAMRNTFGNPDGLFHQDFGDPVNFSQPPPQKSDGGNTCWALMSAQYYCRALPYLSSNLLTQAKARLHRYFADWVLQPERYKPFKGKLLLVGPGIGTWGGYDDAGKFSSNVLTTLWAYAEYSGDWSLIRQRWTLIRKLFVTPRECTWRGFGRDSIAEMGDEASPPLACARMAYRIGDKAVFAWGAYIFVRELTHLIVKQTGATYFVKHQPINSMEKIPDDVYLTNLWGDTAGWQIDGPTYPQHTGERQYTNRWVRFGDPDVARFLRDHAEDLIRKELDGLLSSGRFTVNRKNSLDDPHILPSMVRLRSLLLDESPDRLAEITPVNANVYPNSGVVAYCSAFLRTSRPIRYANIIPESKTKTGWLEGIERSRGLDEPILDCSPEWNSGANPNPGQITLTWWGWSPPKSDSSIPGGDRWSFGRILSDEGTLPAKEERLSWNAAAIVLASGDR